MILEILKSAVTISGGDAPLLAKVFWFAMLCAGVLILAVMLKRI